MPNDKARIDERTSPTEWLRRIAKATASPQWLQVTDTIAVAAEIKWDTLSTGVRVLTEAHCQALIVEGVTIEAVIKGSTTTKAQYLRADFEPRNLGNYVFPDPLSHVHSNNKKQPRFALSASNTLTHVDFFELVLRNYARDVWQNWAKDVWRRRVRVKLPDDPTADAMIVVIRTFADNDLDSLRSAPLSEAVRQWRKALRKEKSQMCPLVQDERLLLLNY